MKPKEKAEELFKKYYYMNNDSKSKLRVICFETARQCALIAVDEIIRTYHSPMDDEQIQEWQEVKQEIEKL